MQCKDQRACCEGGMQSSKASKKGVSGKYQVIVERDQGQPKSRADKIKGREKQVNEKARAGETRAGKQGQGKIDG